MYFLELIYKNDVDAVEKIIKSIDLAQVDSVGDNALHIAILKKNVLIVDMLLAKGVNVNHQNKDGKVPLHYVAENNLLEVAKKLLRHGAKLDKEDKFGNQPLWVAVFSAADGDSVKLPLVELYLKHGADKKHKNNAGRSPLDFANQVKFAPLLEVLNKY